MKGLRWCAHEATLIYIVSVQRIIVTFIFNMWL